MTMRLSNAANKLGAIKSNLEIKIRNIIRSYSKTINEPLTNAREEIQTVLKDSRRELRELAEANPGSKSINSALKALSKTLDPTKILPDFKIDTHLQNLYHQARLGFGRFIKPFTGEVLPLKFGINRGLELLAPGQACDFYHKVNAFEGFIGKTDASKKAKFSKFLKDKLGIDIKFGKVETFDDVPKLWVSFMQQINRLARRLKDNKLINANSLTDYVTMFDRFFQKHQNGLSQPSVGVGDFDYTSEPAYRKLQSHLQAQAA